MRRRSANARQRSKSDSLSPVICANRDAVTAPETAIGQIGNRPNADLDRDEVPGAAPGARTGALDVAAPFRHRTGPAQSRVETAIATRPVPATGGPQNPAGVEWVSAGGTVSPDLALERFDQANAPDSRPARTPITASSRPRRIREMGVRPRNCGTEA